MLPLVWNRPADCHHDIHIGVAPLVAVVFAQPTTQRAAFLLAQFDPTLLSGFVAFRTIFTRLSTRFFTLNPFAALFARLFTLGATFGFPLVLALLLRCLLLALLGLLGASLAALFARLVTLGATFGFPLVLALLLRCPLLALLGLLGASLAALFFPPWLLPGPGLAIFPALAAFRGLRAFATLLGTFPAPLRLLRALRPVPFAAAAGRFGPFALRRLLGL
ncbi:MAG: hypothetical protein ACLFU3_00260, partial [Dichotomicrobium sp.]